jgi:hypothetical protein
MNSLYFIGFIKTLMLTTPFFTMILMVFALWGVGGKTIYPDLNPANQQIGFNNAEAKNILVNETKVDELTSTELESPKICVEEKKNDTAKKEPLPKKIGRGHVV